MPNTQKYLAQEAPDFTAASLAGMVGEHGLRECVGRTPSKYVSRSMGKAGGSDQESAVLQDSDRERILLETMPEVRYVALSIHARLPHHIELEDLISAGVVGLMDAFGKFDHTKRAQFKTYAKFRIRGAILDALRSQDWSPRDLRRKGRSVQEAIRTLSNDLQRKPTEQEVASQLQLSLADYHKLLGDLNGLEIGSLDAELSPDSDEDELARVAGSPDESPLLRCLQGEKKQHVTEAVDDLPERERLVLSLYYYEDLTMKEIGAIIGTVESRVSQIHTSALLHLRSSLNAFRQVKPSLPQKDAASNRSKFSNSFMVP